MASPMQFAFRTQKTIGVFDADPVYEILPGFVSPEGNLRCCEYSPCGRYFAWASNEFVSIHDASVGHVVSSMVVKNVFELSFSPKGTFLSTWERPAKDEAGDATKNLKIWRTVEDLPEGTQKTPHGCFVQKSQSGWNLQYTADESLCARVVTNEVQFYDTQDLKTVWNKLRVEGVATFALCPGQAHAVAVFIPERKGQPASVKVYNVPQFSNPTSQKTFFKGDKVQLKWNSQGTSLLVLAQTDVDKSNKSYYGETMLYLLSVNESFDARISLDKEGPIHDVTWSPNGKEFGVIYGFMPAKTTIFNHRAVLQHSFPSGPRNTIIFSPTGRFALVAGFGNLAGQIDVYDLERDYAKICTIESGNPSVCQWSPDSRYIMTATTSPRLRVDNGVKLWHVGGGIMYNEDMVELYNVCWRPVLPKNLPGGDPLHPIPNPHASALAYLGTIKTPSKPVGAYRPPGARGQSTPSLFKREDQGGAAHTSSFGNGLGANPTGSNIFGRPRRAVPGAEFVEAPTGHSAGRSVPGAVKANDDQLSKAAMKNKKKRNNKKKEGDQQQQQQGSQNNGGLAPPTPDRGVGSGSDGRSPERRPRNYNHNNHNNHNNRHRSHSRHNGGRHRSNTAQASSINPNGSGDVRVASGDVRNASGDVRNANGGSALREVTTANQELAAANANADEAAGSQNPMARKIRSLTKKLRAIEELEMRRASGEKLEDTQLKKIATKDTVRTELEVLGVTN
ncbi:putative eukaryotic translation initiation factor 2a protein [Zalerion maritima]|uniref:Eukaryotic translation initiation factor 2A n=1 Tax=Zalerion maritima TaxID=339359 RepID=A0AAD5WN10_9PEZI|nr:putative eukaryotic translation initiation factor 2a protein [Zalerion maritima]